MLDWLIICASGSLMAVAPDVASSQTVYVIGDSTVPGATRYATLTQFSKAVPCLRGGDTVLLEGGKTHVGRLDLVECEDPGASPERPIEVRAVAPGGSTDRAPRAVIKGTANAQSLGLSWRELPSSQMAALGLNAPTGSTAWAMGPLPDQVVDVLIDGEWLQPAQWPNSEEVSGAPAFEATTTLASKQSECSAELCVRNEADPALKMLLERLEVMDKRRWPRLLLRNSPWSLSHHTIVELDAAKGEIRSSTSAYGSNQPVGKLPPTGSGFVLLGSGALLDRDGEWFFDPMSKTLHVLRSDSKPPPPSSRTELFLDVDKGRAATSRANSTVSYWQPDAPGRRHIRDLNIADLEIVGSAGSGIRLSGVRNVGVSNTIVRFARENGILIHQAHGQVTVQDSAVENSGRNGILISETESAKVRRTTVKRAGQIRLQSTYGMDFAGIRASGYSSIALEENQIDTTGYAGIMLSERRSPVAGGAPETVVSSNRISNFCALLNDCAAIYINGQWLKDQDRAAPSRTSKRVTGNQIAKPIGFLGGLPSSAGRVTGEATKSGTWSRFVGAIYLDQGASGFDVRNNEISGKYEPYGWRVFNRGVQNGCSRDQIDQCRREYQCYTKALDSCNTINE